LPCVRPHLVVIGSTSSPSDVVCPSSFLEFPSQSLDGTAVGDLGFDPFGVSSYTNMLYAREAEIKHGRIAMLAFAGIVIETLGIKAPGAEKIYGGSTVSTPPYGRLPGLHFFV